MKIQTLVTCQLAPINLNIPIYIFEINYLRIVTSYDL